MDIARALGRTVAELRSTLSQRDYVQQLAYQQREPRGDKRLDANIGWLIYNMRRCIGDKDCTLPECTLDYDKLRRDAQKAKDPIAINTANAEKLRAIANAFRCMKGR